MTLKEIKKAVQNGKIVCWKQNNYVVIKGKFEYLIKCLNNEHCIGLTWNDGKTLNGEEKDFYILNDNTLLAELAN